MSDLATDDRKRPVMHMAREMPAFAYLLALAVKKQIGNEPFPPKDEEAAAKFFATAITHAASASALPIEELYHFPHGNALDWRGQGHYLIEDAAERRHVFIPRKDKRWVLNMDPVYLKAWEVARAVRRCAAEGIKGSALLPNPNEYSWGKPSPLEEKLKVGADTARDLLKVAELCGTLRYEPPRAEGWYLPHKSPSRHTAP